MTGAIWQRGTLHVRTGRRDGRSEALGGLEPHSQRAETGAFPRRPKPRDKTPAQPRYICRYVTASQSAESLPVLTRQTRSSACLQYDREILKSAWGIARVCQGSRRDSKDTTRSRSPSCPPNSSRRTHGGSAWPKTRSAGGPHK